MSDFGETIVREWNKLFHNDEISWGEIKPGSIPDSTIEYILIMTGGTGIRFEIANQIVHGSYLFRTNDPILKYLHHWPEQKVHIWLGDDFDNIKQNKYLSRLAVLAGKAPDEATAETIFDFIDGLEGLEGI